MKITLSPISSGHDSTVSVDGEVLTINGVAHDLSVIPDGGEATDEDADSPFIGPIRRAGGQIVCTVRYSYNAATAEAMQPTDWADFTFQINSGRVPDPIRRRTMEPAQ